MSTTPITIGVLALQGGFHEHLNLLHAAAPAFPSLSFTFIQVRTPTALSACSALIIPGGESTTIANLAEQSGLMEPLREFVNISKKPVWGTCAGLILLSAGAHGAKTGGQELIGGLNVRVRRNHFGRQVDSFFTEMELAFLSDGERPFQGVFIRAPVVDEVLEGNAEVLARLEPKEEETEGRVVAVREGNVVGTSFHPELTEDRRMHVWWLGEVVKSLGLK